MSALDLQIVRDSPEHRFGRKIAAAWQRSVESILEVGHLLLQAKGALKPGSFESMIDEFCPFSKRTAQRLMKIAAHPVLADATHVSRLPPAWGTLAELARVGPSGSPPRSTRASSRRT